MSVQKFKDKIFEVKTTSKSSKIRSLKILRLYSIHWNLVITKVHCHLDLLTGLRQGLNITESAHCCRLEYIFSLNDGR